MSKEKEAYIELSEGIIVDVRYNEKFELNSVNYKGVNVLNIMRLCIENPSIINELKEGLKNY